MPVVAVVAANVVGDIGGQGISRFHVKNTGGTTFSVTDCNAAGAAVRAWYNAMVAYIPSAIQWITQGQVTMIDEESAELQGYVQMGVTPAGVTGSGLGAYPAGNGLRVDWLTSTVRNRRLMRAGNFMVPLSSQGFTTGGQITAGAQIAQINANAALLASLTTASLALVAYHRPAKGTFVGGLAAPVTASKVPVTPASLRSRRT